MPVLDELVIAADADAWRSCGVVVDDAGVALVGSVRLRLVAGEPAAVRSWGLAGLAGDPEPGTEITIDGLPGRAVEASPPGPPGEHPLGLTLIDHLVVMTPDLARTIAALEAAGAPCRRVRDTEAGGRPMQQAFFRLGEVILEVVGAPRATGDGPPSFWGLTFTCADLDAACALLGPERVSGPRSAVQPGRRIATVRGAAGLGIPVALMTS